MDTGIDALIMPVLPWVAFPPKTWVKSKQWVGYTALWNLLDYAALTIPVTTADPVLDQPSEEWLSHIARNEADDFNHKQCKSFHITQSSLFLTNCSQYRACEGYASWSADCRRSIWRGEGRRCCKINFESVDLVQDSTHEGTELLGRREHNEFTWFRSLHRVLGAC